MKEEAWPSYSNSSVITSITPALQRSKGNTSMKPKVNQVINTQPLFIYVHFFRIPMLPWPENVLIAATKISQTLDEFKWCRTFSKGHFRPTGPSDVCLFVCIICLSQALFSPLVMLLTILFIRISEVDWGINKYIVRMHIEREKKNSFKYCVCNYIAQTFKWGGDRMNIIWGGHLISPPTSIQFWSFLSLSFLVGDYGCQRSIIYHTIALFHLSLFLV